MRSGESKHDDPSAVSVIPSFLSAPTPSWLCVSWVGPFIFLQIYGAVAGFEDSQGETNCPPSVVVSRVSPISMNRSAPGELPNQLH